MPFKIQHVPGAPELIYYMVPGGNSHALPRIVSLSLQYHDYCDNIFVELYI